ncbi:hypothetical protein [Lacinutrix sp. 5H-3-7-4]|uniref:hypothetical protein n=1 Tax=Lacinutrix sp. (strain 5H-3-7-4) TaxID=983544 RepID=UPI00020A3C23|nr:hypothetical protein [Lacinutrix sp. 5H-3-7-4]AEH01973.1 hypothetical protein Lacal_2127 [Lacinutrix sp. 5H-3-7-4]
MIFLNANSISVIKAKRYHKDMMLDLLYERIDDIENLLLKQIFDNVINNYLERIIIGEPKELIQFSESILSIIGKNETLLKDLKKVFNYKWFISKTVNRYSGYDLASRLDISTCTYCNRNYTNTVITRQGKKIIRPQFDHYFDKDSHPILALSFFNLIPSCSICNTSVKHKKEFKLNTHPHPYFDDILGEFEFNFSFTNDPYYKNGLKVSVDVENDWFAKNYLNDLAIEEVYSAHTDILYDLLLTKQAYSDRYLSILEDTVLKDFNLSRNEIYRLVYGVYLSEKDFQKRPFSKFKKDILTELDII